MPAKGRRPLYDPTFRCRSASELLEPDTVGPQASSLEPQAP